MIQEKEGADHLNSLEAELAELVSVESQTIVPDDTPYKPLNLNLVQAALEINPNATGKTMSTARPDD